MEMTMAKKVMRRINFSHWCATHSTIMEMVTCMQRRGVEVSREDMGG